MAILSVSLSVAVIVIAFATVRGFRDEIKHKISMVHGMTLGELAKMINGEHWLPKNLTCKLEVIPIQNYFHNLFYPLPVAPSPNLPNPTSIILYSSLGLFEGTQISMGRGTEKPFECFGAPWLKMGNYQFTPVNIPGKAVNPPCHKPLVQLLFRL